MNRMSQLRGGTSGKGKITLFTHEDFEGASLEIEDSNMQIQKLWPHDRIRSVIVQGNPWVLFEEPGFWGVPAFFEEGRYKVIEFMCDLKKTGSAKQLQDDLGSPEISLFSPSRFTGTYEWEKIDDPTTMKWVSVGKAGIWAARAKDDSLWVRTADGKPGGKTEADSDQGSVWMKMQGSAKQVSVGTTSVWCVKADGVVNARIGIGPDSPCGKEWATVDGEPMKHISVSSEGHVWAIDEKEKIWYRKGANNQFALGTGWKMVSGNLKQISVGKCGVWGVNSDYQVWFRLNTFGDPETDGTGWMRIDGRFQQVYSGPEGVIALAANRDLYYRANVGEKDGKSMTSFNEGTHWIRIEQDKEAKIIFKQFEFAKNSLWAVDKDNNVFYKQGIFDDLESNYAVRVFGDEPDFSMYNFAEKGTTAKVSSGGWALYSEPNYKGKVSYLFPNDSVGNDPPSKVNPMKAWFAQIGSCRPIRGQNYRTPMMRINLDWAKKEVSSSEEILFSQDVTNESDDYLDAPWLPTFDLETCVTHQFEVYLMQYLSGGSVIRGCEFTVNNTEPIEFEIGESGPNLFTGDDFHQQLDTTFVFKDETKSTTQAKKTRIIKLPPLVPPKCTFRAKIVMYRAKVKVPFEAEFKVGFSPKFEEGGESWHENGMYEGSDESNVKINLECIRMANTRKVSKMINGLGDDM